jgi:hypothetical protein
VVNAEQSQVNCNTVAIALKDAFASEGVSYYTHCCSAAQQHIAQIITLRCNFFLGDA